MYAFRKRWMRLLESPVACSAMRASPSLDEMFTSLIMFLKAAFQVLKFSGELSNFSILLAMSSLLERNWTKPSMRSVGLGLKGSAPGLSSFAKQGFSSLTEKPRAERFFASRLRSWWSSYGFKPSNWLSMNCWTRLLESSIGKSIVWKSRINPSSSSIAFAQGTATAASCSACRDSKRASSSRFLLANANSSSRLFLSSCSNASADLVWNSEIFLCISAFLMPRPPRLLHGPVVCSRKRTTWKHVTQTERILIPVRGHFSGPTLR